MKKRFAWAAFDITRDSRWRCANHRSWSYFFNFTPKEGRLLSQIASLQIYFQVIDNFYLDSIRDKKLAWLAP